MLFVPRQVALASLPLAAAAMEPTTRKGKKKGSSKASGDSPDVRKAAVVAAVAVFLESSGFPRTLAALQSEANIEGEAWRSSQVKLEDLVTEFLELRHSAPGAEAAASNEQGRTVSPYDMYDRTVEAVAGEEDTDKKKKKKKKQKKGDVEAHEPEIEVTEPSAIEKPIDNADGETKEKKRKKKKDKSSVENDGGVEAKETVKSDDQKVEGKKKKSKKQENDEDVEARLEKVELAVKSKFEAAEKLKLDAKKSEKEESKSKNDDDEKKSKKKSKKLRSEDKKVPETDSVPKSDADNTEMVIDKCKDGKPSIDNVVVSKKRKLEEVEGSKVSAKEDDTSNQNINNGYAEDPNEHSTVTKPSKRQKHSSEPKTLIAFQRVKLDDVKFADERLQDNSYWAKGGADSGYGAKAQEILGQVKGRGFRHEKTKKKRGTYRGGMIDLQTHSIKFDNSDNE